MHATMQVTVRLPLQRGVRPPLHVQVAAQGFSAHYRKYPAARFTGWHHRLHVPVPVPHQWHVAAATSEGFLAPEDQPLNSNQCNIIPEAEEPSIPEVCCSCAGTKILQKTTDTPEPSHQDRSNQQHSAW